ncbi:hypothetical protein BPOR_0927g00050 [Botrytis porri]|uniref:Uncharacterized protein n=1 Tax=Botrytis porri TaxID=87229 RepID=A0A4Z1KD13_9HELO|nr:hypothetical protein BPOR_0927g00050 [Botrytis porri]
MYAEWRTVRHKCHPHREVLSPYIGDTVFDFKYNESVGFKLINEMTNKTEVVQSEYEELNTSSSAIPSSNGIDADTLKNFYPQIIQVPIGLFVNTRTTAYSLECPSTTQRNPTSIAICHPTSYGPPVLEIPLQVPKEKSATIHQLAAREAILDIEESRGWIYSPTTSETQTLAEKETIRLGEAFQIMNEWCSFVAVRSSDEGSLNEKPFQPSPSDANLSTIILPKTPPPKLDSAAMLNALKNNRPNTDERTIGGHRRQAFMEPPPVRPRIQSIPDDMQFRCLSDTSDTIVLPLTVNKPSPVNPRLQPSQDNTKLRPSSGVKIFTLPIITLPVPVVYSLYNPILVPALIDLQSFDGP